MDQPRLLTRTAVAAAAVAAAAVALAACGGSAKVAGSEDGQVGFVDDRSGLVTPTPQQDDANRSPRGASVNYNDPAPPIAPAVTAAANAAGCRARGFQAEPAQVQADGTYHVEGTPTYRVSIPPLSGLHNVRWADWGVYNRPVPYRYQVHDLEHGGVVIHYGRDVSVESVNALRTLWAKSPAYVSVMPDSNPSFPTNAVVAGSWQRWVACKPFSPAKIGTIEAFIETYRGRGPEQAPAIDAGGELPSDLPAPAIADPGAKR